MRGVEGNRNLVVGILVDKVLTVLHSNSKWCTLSIIFSIFLADLRRKIFGSFGDDDGRGGDKEHKQKRKGEE